MSIAVNGVAVLPPNDARASLLDLLREELYLPGTKKGFNPGSLRRLYRSGRR